jgi:serine/threonine protein phosphatase 1
MRYLAIGDIHGAFKALETLASFVPFGPDDVVITLGDHINRGPDSKKVLDWIIQRHREKRLIPLRGNHELMTVDARDNPLNYQSWLRCGGDATLASYVPSGRGNLTHIPAKHWDFLENQLLDFFEIDTHIFVHANLDPDLAMADQPSYLLHWEKFKDPPPHCSGKVMVCGHTCQRSGVPLSIGHAVCLDTYAYGSGWLTCLDVATDCYWQANQKGQTRTGTIEF